MMEPLVIGVDASDDRLPESYDQLATKLEGQGTVYIPHVVIRPEARMAVRRPPRLVVGLTSLAAFGELEEWAGEYLASNPDARLHFQRNGRTVLLQGVDVASTRGMLEGLASA